MTPDHTSTATRRRVLRTTAALVAGGVGVAAGAGGAGAARGSPDFSPRVYGDGRTWGTKGATTLPAPTDRTRKAYDGLYVVTNSNATGVQLPVSEAAPGNPAYDGGRWITHTASWTPAGFAAHGTVPLLTRYGPASDPASVLFHEERGHLTVTAGSPDAAVAPDYFECPLLPVRE